MRQIDKNKWYKTREVIANGFLNPIYDRYVSRQFIYRLIETGHLKARNISLGNGKYWMIKGESIIKLIKINQQ